jgi:hypothetical protein
MIERPFSYDPETGARETFIFDELTESFSIVHSVDIQPVMEVAHEERKQFRGPRGGRWGKQFMHKVASVPMGVYHEQIVKKGLQKDQKALKKFLNASENQMFRTRPGRV